MMEEKEDITQEAVVEQMEGGTMSLDGMFKDYWIDYASDVILDRSVPDIDDGLKPVCFCRKNPTCRRCL